MPKNVTRFTLFDPATGVELGPLVDGQSIDPHVLPGGYQIRARVSAGTARVQFTVDGAAWLDGSYPFAAPGPVLPGTHLIVAAAADATGSFGPSKTLRMTIAAPFRRQLVSGLHLTLADGIDPVAAAPMFRELGVNSVRIPVDIGRWTQLPSAGLDACRAYRDQGFFPTCCLYSKTAPATAQAADFAKRLVAAAPDLNWAHGHRWELLNEPNLKNFWATGDIKLAIDRVLAPMFPILDAAGHRVVGFALSGSGDRAYAIRQLIGWNYAKSVHEWAWHEYGETAAANRQSLATVRATLDAAACKPAGVTQPLLITEYGLHPSILPAPMTNPQLAEAKKQVAINVKTYGDGGYAYRAIDNSSPGGRGGPFKIAAGTLVPNEPFYSALKAALAA